MILDNKLSMGHARVLSKIEDTSQIENLANRVINENLSVRDLENLSSANIEIKKRIPITRKEKNSDYNYIETELREILGTKVTINNKKVEIYFENNNDLDRILEIMNIKIK